jgi:2-oxoglutarate ferredoxin oxidoreductase subunit delta
MIQIEEIRCKSCGLCVEFCPKKCLIITEKINEKGHKIAGIIDQSCCVSCGICYTVCPDIAITVL